MIVELTKDQIINLELDRNKFHFSFAIDDVHHYKEFVDWLFDEIKGQYDINYYNDKPTMVFSLEQEDAVMMKLMF